MSTSTSTMARPAQPRQRVRHFLLLSFLWFLLYHVQGSEAILASLLKTVATIPHLSSSSASSPSSPTSSPPPDASSTLSLTKLKTWHHHHHRHRQQHSLKSPPLFPTSAALVRYIRHLLQKITHLFHKEIEALAEADPREENLLELLRTLPEAVQEGHHETVHSLRRGWATLQQKALEGLLFKGGNEEGVEGGLLSEGGGGGGGGKGALALAMAAAHASQMEHHATMWVTQNKPEHLNRALHYLSFLSEQAPKTLDAPSQLDLVERVLVIMRCATEGGLMPGADGRKKTMSPQQVKLVHSVQPVVMQMLERIQGEEEEEEQQQRVVGKGGKKNPRLHLLLAETMGFNLGTARGLSAAACLGQVKRMAQSIDVAVRHEPSLDSGLPYIIRGMYHLNCPVPLKSITKARRCFLEALKVNPQSGRNLYFSGLGAYLEGNFEEAHNHYAAAQALLPAETKRDAQYAFLEVECQKGMALVEAKQQQGREGGGVGGG